MSTLLTRLRDKLTGRNPADVAAEAIYQAMVALPLYVKTAQECERLTTSSARAAVLASVDDETRAQAVAFMQEPMALRERNRRLAWARADSPKRFPGLLTYYAKHIPQFVDDWALTTDPRSRDAKIAPFRLYKRQWELARELLDAYHNGESLSVVKSRDCGASWLTMCLAVSLAIFEPGFVCLVGSALEVKLDQSGTNANTLFGKARMFLEYLPPEFRGGWTPKNGDLYMRLFWANGSVIFGQAGEQIGRGERASIALLDEVAWIPHPQKIDEALTATSEVKWYVSTPNGQDNPFAERVREGRTRIFRYSWKDDPRKTEEWAQKKIAADGQRRFDQEYCCQFNVGNIDQMFPPAHLDAMLDAHLKLEVEPNGRRFGGFDPGGGSDPSAFCVAEGPVITHAESWPSSPNIKQELRRAFAICDRFGITEFNADCCGIGNGLESIAAELNADRVTNKQPRIKMHPFKASEKPLQPERPCVPGSSMKAKDWYPNKKSQAYDSIRYRAGVTYRMLQGETGDPENIISISSQIPAEHRNKLMLELQQITCKETLGGGKLQILKYGAAGANESPNLADAFALAAAPRIPPMEWRADVLDGLSRPSGPGSSYMRGY
jgi:phage terminase large subunit